MLADVQAGVAASENQPRRGGLNAQVVRKTRRVAELRARHLWGSDPTSPRPAECPRARWPALSADSAS
eukprot:11947628-Alexandrium_andersonii.AAC.1